MNNAMHNYGKNAIPRELSISFSSTTLIRQAVLHPSRLPRFKTDSIDTHRKDPHRELCICNTGSYKKDYSDDALYG